MTQKSLNVGNEEAEKTGGTIVTEERPTNTKEIKRK